jgi:phospholipase/lecithinase/hemolysin
MRFILAACLSLLAAAPALADPFSGIYFFGDSLTDTGNVTTVYATVPKAPGDPTVVPGPPYDPEGRASNGLLYADMLAAGLGFDAQASERGGNNFAFGGARTRYESPFGPPFLGIIDQVALFRARPGPADPNALFVVWAGSNNLQDIFLGRTTDLLGNPIPGVRQTLDDIAGVLSGLVEEGAHNLLVPNVPDLGRVPRVRELGGPPAQAAATALVQAFDDGLDTMLDSFEAAHPDVNLIRFDSFAAFEDIVANSAIHGLLNITDRCYTGDDVHFTGGGTVCANPDQYLFWDGIHPTTATHRLLGDAMLTALQVPEPTSAALTAAGLVVLLLWRRYRAL